MTDDNLRDFGKARLARLAHATESQGTTMRGLLRSGNPEVFRRLVDSVRDYAIFLLTPDGYIASWNEGAVRIKGYAADEAIGQHFSLFYTPEAVASGWPAEELRRCLEQGHFEDEGWRVRKDGTRFWANAIISPVWGGSGELLGFSKVTRDLTERREHERRLQESERNLRLLIEGVQDYAIFQLDRNGVIASWNLGAQRIKGYAAEEIIGKHFSVFYPPDAVARGWPDEELRRASQTGRFEDEGWRVCKDGTRIWANVVITSIRDEHGELLGYSKVTRDLTERRRQEEALREREENLRLLVEGVKDHAMFLLDASGRIRTWNGGAERVLGYAGAQIIGRDVAVLYPADEIAAGRARANIASARAGDFTQVEGWMQRADGVKFWAESSTTVLRGDGNETRGYVQIVRDLTQRRRVETLEQEGRRISEFIAMLSHELRNPLAPIRNAVEVLKRFAQQPEAAWCVELLGRQVGHMTRLVDDLLDISRITSGKIRLERRALDLNTLVQMAVDTVKSIVESHQHTLQLQTARRPVVVMGDSTRLTQLVVNLVTNAAKYTPPGGHIRLSVHQDGPVAQLQVSDNGIGMSEALLQRAFEPFVQGERTLDRAEGGLGIGLTLVKRIAELHGGTVTAASGGLGHGTTMTITLPVAKSETDESREKPGAPEAHAQRVLVVDDNRDAAESLALLLRFHGHEVHVAHDGPAALSLAAALRPGIVLMDIGLPGMSGLEAARRLRELPGMNQARLVAVTGYGQHGDRESTEGAGFDQHFTKPVDIDALLAALR